MFAFFFRNVHDRKAAQFHKSTNPVIDLSVLLFLFVFCSEACFLEAEPISLCDVTPVCETLPELMLLCALKWGNAKR